MKIAYTTDGELEIRSRHFLNTLKQRGHTIFKHSEEIKCVPDSDVWLFEYMYKTSDPKTINIARLEYWLPQFLKFPGKLILLETSDANSIHGKYMNELLRNRIDAVVTFCKYPENHHSSSGIYDKIVLIPRYTLPHINNIIPEKRNNKIFFVGRVTGSNFFSGCNWRIEALKLIYQDEFLKNNFEGWLCRDPVHVLSQSLISQPNYLSTIVGDKPYKISNDEYIQHLCNNITSLCMPGNTAWGYRHIQSMQCRNAIISFPLNINNREWLFQDSFNDSYYFLQPDLSDFKQVLSYAIHNEQESIRRGEMNYQIYCRTFKLDAGDVYQSHVWDIVDEQLQQLKIQL